MSSATLRADAVARRPEAVPPANIDVADLPSYGFSHHSIMWWGTLGVIAIEGTVFALAVGTYLYLRSRIPDWPPSAPPPELRWGIVNTVILLVSLIPNHIAKQGGEHHDMRKCRIGLVLGLVFAIGFLIVRWLEFTALNVRWDDNAYGSIVWTLLGLHTVHLLTDAFDTAVLTVLMFTGPIEGKRFVDVSENAFYWYFVVFAWIPIAATIYLGPRLL